MKIFSSARLKVTAWYLAIIMLISLLFSVVIYAAADEELRLHLESHRILAERVRGTVQNITIVDPSQDQEVRKRVVVTLVLVNVLIFIAAGSTGYFLAGRTLKPIKDMVEEQNRFATDASHELRTPLTALRTSLEVNLRDRNLTSQVKDLLQIYLGEVKNLQRISDSLLELARMQKPNPYSNFINVSIQEIVGEAVKSVQLLAQEKNISIEKNIKNTAVYGNKKGLAKLLTAILDNAIKYNKGNGKISIATTVVNGQVKIKVRDWGIGISQKDLPHIFDRFYRADWSRSKKETGGFGLGLSIAQKIAETHKGHIDVVSTLNRGSTFTVSLPAYRTS